MTTVLHLLSYAFWKREIENSIVPFITCSYKKRKLKDCSLLYTVKKCDCWRSRSRSPSQGWRYSNDSSGSDRVDAIDFQTNRDVILSGYRLWGVRRGSTSFQVTISLYRGSNLIAEKTGSYATRSSVKTFEVHFSQVISICTGVTYTAKARIATSKSSFYHSDGLASASCSGVTVNFKTKSSKDSNGSSQSVGQIPILIFRSSQC